MTRTTDSVILGSGGGAYTATAFVEKIDTWRDALTPVGRFEILFNRKLEQAGTTLDLTKIFAQQVITISLSSALVMKGYLDTGKRKAAQAEGSHHRKQYQISGRDVGQDLDNKMLPYELSYVNEKGDDIIEDLITKTLCEVTFVSPSTAPVLAQYTTFDKPLSKNFAEILERIGYDGLVNEDTKAWTMFDIGSLSSGIALKALANDPTNNIIDLEKLDFDAVDVWNYVIVRGREVKDGWSEENADDWDHDVGNVVTNERVDILAGASAIKCANGTAGGLCHLALDFSPISLYNYAQLRWDKLGSATMSAFVKQSCTAFPGIKRGIYIRLRDSANNRISFYDEVQYLPGETWVKISAPVGVDASIWNAVEKKGAWIFLTGTSFNWRITRIEFEISMPDDATSYLLLDDLQLPGVEMYALAEDPGSQGSYRKRSISINRADIYSQKELQVVANNYIANLHEILQGLKITAVGSAGIIGGVNKWLPGYTLIAESTDDDINATYRIMSVHLTAAKTELAAGHDFIAELELVPYLEEVESIRYMKATKGRQGIFTSHVQRISNLERGNFGVAGDCASKIGSPIVTDAQVDPNANLDGAKFKDATITNSKFVDGTIENTKIKDSTITGSKFVDGTIENSKIHDSTITNSKFVDGTIENSKIKDGTLTNALFADNQITLAKLYYFTPSDVYYKDDRYIFSGESLAGYDLSGCSGSGSVTAGANYIKLSTGTTNNSYASCKSLAETLEVSYNPRLKARVTVNVNDRSFIVRAVDSSVEDEFGFWFSTNGYIYGRTGNAGGFTNTLLMAYAANTNYVLEALYDYDAGKCYFYVNGVLKATVTATLPASGLVFAITAQAYNGSSGGINVIAYIYYYTVTEDWM